MRELHKTYAEAARFGVKGWRIVSHLEQLQRYGGCPGMVTCPQPIHKYHSPSDLAFINLKFSPSVQYGHRIGFGIFNLLGQRRHLAAWQIVRGVPASASSPSQGK